MDERDSVVNVVIPDVDCRRGLDDCVSARRVLFLPSYTSADSVETVTPPENASKASDVRAPFDSHRQAMSLWL